MTTLIEFIETFVWVFPCILILFIAQDILFKYIHILTNTNS